MDPLVNYGRALRELGLVNSAIEFDQRQDRIHCHYDLTDTPHQSRTKITLFKAVKTTDMAQLDEQDLSEVNEKMLKQNEVIGSYYRNITDNLISDFVKAEQLQVFKLNSCHNTWVKDEQDMAMVAEMIAKAGN